MLQDIWCIHQCDDCGHYELIPQANWGVIGMIVVSNQLDKAENVPANLSKLNITLVVVLQTNQVIITFWRLQKQ